MRIISNVMKLQSGGEPKRVRYISAPSRNINRGTGDPDRVTSVGDEIAKAREWDAKMDPARTDYKYKDYKYWLDKYGLDYGKEKSELLMNTVAQAQPTNNGTLFAQEGTVLRQDNTRVAKPVIPELIKAKPRQYYITDLGGEPSTDNRTAAERNRDYWHPFKGAKERFKASMRNGTNPLVGLERTVMPAMAGATLVTTPATAVGGILGSEAVNNATGGFGQWLEGKVGIPAEIGEYLNPGAVYGGKGLNITKNKLATKFIKGGIFKGGNNNYINNAAEVKARLNSMRRDAKMDPAKGQGFNYDKRYSELYPGIEGRRYQMQSVVKSGRPLRFNNVDEFNNYSNGIGKLQGKEEIWL